MAIPLRSYVQLWIFLSIALSFEFAALSFAPGLSVLLTLQKMGVIRAETILNTQAGKTISLWLGWSGFSIMCLTNLYSLRKRWSLLKNLGRASRWLDFHIFCGLVGPTFILFHTGFKIGGLVAVSFWSMVISFASGVVGRYFYLQMASGRAELEKMIEFYTLELKKIFARISPNDAERVAVLVTRGAQYANLPSEDDRTGMIEAVVKSVASDLRLRATLEKNMPEIPYEARFGLRKIFTYRRRVTYLAQFQKIMGYWHSFHLPFAVFMYVVAAIHIATALLLQVSD